jgi:hypothetical protein
MQDGLLLLERIIIESISKKEKNIQELSIDTNLEHALLLNLLPILLMKNIIKYQHGLYRIDKENSLLWRESINHPENIKEETKELFTSLVNKYFAKDIEEKSNSVLKVKKVWLTNSEEKILNGHMVVLENFFNEVKNSRKRNPLKEKTCEQKIVIWGTSLYSELLHGVLEAV